MGVGSLDLLFGTCRLWGRFKILYNYVNEALRLEFWVCDGMLFCLALLK